jgi:hypothetical protein
MKLVIQNTSNYFIPDEYEEILDSNENSLSHVVKSIRLNKRDFEEPDFYYLKIFGQNLQKINAFTLDFYSVIKYGASKDSFMMFLWMY